MIECSQCNTLNPDAEAGCLACGSPLAARQATATGVSGATGRCPAGHPVDPSWKSCPYCERQAATASPAGARATRLDDGAAPPPQKTRLELDGAAPRASGTRLAGEPSPPAPAPTAGPNPTRLEEPEPARGRPTMLHDGGAAPSPSAAPAPGAPPASVQHPPPAAAAAPSVRRLIAVLAAPDLGAGGAVFAVRSGRNTLGSDRSNDIVLDADMEVSREHAVILHRNGSFHLADRLSTNGTWVNGQEVPANGTVAIEDRDRIRLGRTELVFLRVDPPAAPSPD